MKTAVAFLTFFVAYASAFGVLEEEIKIEKVVGGISGTGTTTRYWDCCKPTCSWPGNVNYKKPVKACKADGVTANDPENQSGCVGGQSYMCTNQSGYGKNNTLAYGFVAAKFIHTNRNMCCSCVLFTFNTKYPSPLNGKKMLVQVTNTGEDDPHATHNEFDIAMPGSGVGYYQKGCPGQWKTHDQSIWGDQYGGVHEEKDCYRLPKALQPGCLFRFHWMSGYSNPDVSFVEVTCPKELINISGCSPVSY